MRPGSVDFASLNAAPEEVERVYYERLAYRKAKAETGEKVGRPSASGTNYATVIVHLASSNSLARFDQLVAELRHRYDDEMRRLGQQSSVYGNDDSWINWDLAKQLYLFLGARPPWPITRYRIADPLVDEQIREEIVSRHIGWEFVAGGWDPWVNRADLRFLLGPECESSKRKGWPASWALAKLGAIVRAP